MAGSKKSDPDQYTKPELRDHIKEEVMAGDKGGNPGQWSARKAQLVAQEYEREGGGYKHAPNETQESLKQWGDEHWTTADHQKARRHGETARYLPEDAWKKLSPEEKAKTDRQKRQGSKRGKQFVANTPKAAEARKAVAKKTPATKKSAAPAKAKTTRKRASTARKKA